MTDTRDSEICYYLIRRSGKAENDLGAILAIVSLTSPYMKHLYILKYWHYSRLYFRTGARKSNYRVQQVPAKICHCTISSKCSLCSPTFAEIGDRELELTLDRTNGANVGKPGLPLMETDYSLRDARLYRHLYLYSPAS